VLAAGLSSASTFLSLVGFSVSHDILGSSSEQGCAAGENNTESRLHLRAARLAMLMVGLSVIGLALLLPRNIYWLTHFAGPLFASSWGVVAFMSIWSGRLTEAGAFWGMVAGFGVNVTMNALSLTGWVQWPVVADPILVGVVSSYLVVRVVSNRGVVSVTEANYREALHRMPPQERDPAVIRQTLVWPKVMVAMGAVIAVALTLFYAVPYQQAIASAEQVAREVAL
jgi:sodium/pantothenate symporter